MTTAQEFIRIKPEENPMYFHLFEDFPYFENYIQFAFKYMTPEIWVKNPPDPSAAYFYTAPAYFLTGNPDSLAVHQLLSVISKNSWILSSDERWKSYLSMYFGKKLEVHKRTLFDASSLQLEHVRLFKKELPSGLDLVQIGEQQINLPNSLLTRDILQRYFVKTDFSADGFGFCVMDGEDLVGFACSNFPIRGNILEVYVRVLDDPLYRQKGLGMALSATLIEACLLQGIEPVWDAANPISAHMAEKLGYSVLRDWEMYHIL